MNPAPVPSKPRRQVWPWIVGLILSPFVVVAVMAASVIRLNRDAAVLRDEVMHAAGRGWQTRVQLSVPAPVFSLVRTGFACARSLPEEAREAIKVVRSASVGVFEHGGPDADLAGDALVPAADAAMARRGWTRVVGVRDGGNTVLIYLPDGRADTKPSRVCLAVCDGQHLVVVSAVISADAIADLVAHELDKHGSVRL